MDERRELWLAPDTLISIRYALAFKALKLCGSIKWDRRQIKPWEYDIMAKAIAEHMRRSNYLLEKGPLVAPTNILFRHLPEPHEPDEGTS